MSSSIVAGVLAATAEQVPELSEIDLPIPAIVYGLIAFAVFMVLLGVTYSFKNVAARR